jgi:hypothetical protein
MTYYRYIPNETEPPTMTVNSQAKETAKSLRTQLKAEFPGVKFSVSCKCVSSITTMTIEWTDGPDWADVVAIAEPLSDGEMRDGLTGKENPDYKFVTGINEVRCYRDEA